MAVTGRGPGGGDSHAAKCAVRARIWWAQHTPHTRNLSSGLALWPMWVWPRCATSWENSVPCPPPPDNPAVGLRLWPQRRVKGGRGHPVRMLTKNPDAWTALWASLSEAVSSAVCASVSSSVKGVITFVPASQSCVRMQCCPVSSREPDFHNSLSRRLSHPHFKDEKIKAEKSYEMSPWSPLPHAAV